MGVSPRASGGAPRERSPRAPQGSAILVVQNSVTLLTFFILHAMTMCRPNSYLASKISFIDENLDKNNYFYIHIFINSWVQMLCVVSQ
jgi:hypothetical protein